MSAATEGWVMVMWDEWSKERKLLYRIIMKL
ncbi:protein of unknown function [Rhodovastum atsumiense]|nr:protein of unknown function [Rhodovastum atsumiense]